MTTSLRRSYLGRLRRDHRCQVGPVRLRLRHGAAAVALVVALGSTIVSAPAWAADVPVRAATHPDYARVVFDWTTAVEANPRVEGNRLLISFSQPITTSLAPVVARLADYVSGGRVEADGRTVAFDLKRPVTLKTFKSGTKVAVDLVPAANGATPPVATPAPTPAAPTPAAPTPPPTPAPPPPAPPASAADGAPKPRPTPAGMRVPVRGADHPDHTRLVFDWPQDTDYTMRRDGQGITLAFDRPATAVVPKPDYRNVTRIEPFRQTNGALAVTMNVPADAEVRDFKNGKAIVLDIGNPGTRKGEAPPPAAAKPSGPPPPPLPVPPGATTTTVRGAPSATPPQPPGTPPAAPQPPGRQDAAGGPGNVGLVPGVGRAGTLVPVRGTDRPEATQLSIDWPEDADYSIQRDGPRVTVMFNRPGVAQLPPGNLRNVRGLESGRLPNGALSISFDTAADADIRDSKSGKSVVLDVANPGTRKADATRPAPAFGGGARGNDAPPPVAAVAPAVPAPAADAGQTDPLVLEFDAGGPAAMAAFARGGYFYVVFDKTLPLGAGVVTGAQKATVGPVEPVPATGGSAFRTRVGPFLWPKIERKGSVWRITPSTQLVTAPPTELSVVPQPEFLLGARLLIRTDTAGSAVQFIDPEVGDRLQVAPLNAPTFAVTRPHRFPDLEIVPSMQGVVVRPTTDTITLRPVKEGIEISSAGGLQLSPAADTGGPEALAALNAQDARRAVPGKDAPGMAPLAPGSAAREPAPLFSEPSGAKGKRLFDFTAWQHGGAEHFNDARQDLQLAVAEAPEEERPRAVLDLARFYLSYGFGPEALGLLGVLSEKQPDLEAWPEFRALRGVGKVLAGDYNSGLDDLAQPGLADNTEASLWRAAASFGKRDWSVAAAGFRGASSLMASYPEPLVTQLALEAAEASLNAGESDMAQGLLDRIMARGGAEAEGLPQVQYLRGRVAQMREDNEQAHELLSNAYNSLDRLVRAKAGLALTNQELHEGKISPDNAVERLAGLTYIWRGDELEMDIRQRLGEILVDAGRYADGFASLRETAAMQPDSPRAAGIAQYMQKTFADLYKDGASKLPVLEAMQLYDQYRELTPVGDAGDDVIRQLAERLAAIDLLGRASDLYEHQVRFRLAGLDKAKVGTRLASLRLLDNKPEDAIRALEMSNVLDIPPALAGERRTMYAKALAQLGRESEALQYLAKDDSRPADLLRVDIAWRAQKWEQAAIALSKVIGAPPAPGKPLDSQTSQLVLNRAVALALGGDGTGLNTLRKDFGTAMAAGPDADAFRILTRPEQATGLIDVDTIKSRVAEVDVFQNFLKGYRARVGQPPAGGAGGAGGKAPAAGG